MYHSVYQVKTKTRQIHDQNQHVFSQLKPETNNLYSVQAKMQSVRDKSQLRQFNRSVDYDLNQAQKLPIHPYAANFQFETDTKLRRLRIPLSLPEGAKTLIKQKLNAFVYTEVEKG